MHSARTKFGRDVLIAGLASFFRSLGSLLMLPLLTHSLSPADFGIWEQIEVGIALALPWVTLQLSGALLRFLPGLQGRAAQEIFYSAAALVAGSSILAALALWWMAPLLGGHPQLEPFLAHANLIALLVPLSALGSLNASYFRAYRLMGRHTLLTLGQSGGELVLIAWALHTGLGLAGGLRALAVARAALVLVGGAMILAHLGWSRPHFSGLGAYLRFSLPQIPNSSFYRLFDAGDRYVLSFFLGNAAVGIYSSAYATGGILTALLAPLHFVLLPAMAELWNTQRWEELRHYLARALRYSCLLGFPCLACMALFPGPILHLLTPRAFDEAARYLPLLALGFLVYGLGIPGDQLLVAAGRTRLLLLLNLGLASLNLLANLLLVPHLKIFGAVLATLAGQSVYTVVTLFLAHRLTAFRLPWKALLHYGGSALAAALLLRLADYWHALPLPAIAVGGAAIYLGLLLLSGGISREELSYLRRL